MMTIMKMMTTMTTMMMMMIEIIVIITMTTKAATLMIITMVIVGVEARVQSEGCLSLVFLSLWGCYKSSWKSSTTSDMLSRPYRWVRRIQAMSYGINKWYTFHLRKWLKTERLVFFFPALICIAYEKNIYLVGFFVTSKILMSIVLKLHYS